MRVFENRASAVLYRFLKSNMSANPFLLPANVCPVVPLTFLKAGVAFEFVDIDVSHAMDRGLCLNKLRTGCYGGVLFVHAYGKVFDNSVFYASLKSIDSSVYIIDDRCLCIPRLTEEVQPHVDLELYSTGYAKYVELSYGGWGVMNDDLNYDRIPIDYKEKDSEKQMAYIRKCLNNGQKYAEKIYDWLDGSALGSVESYLEQVERKLYLMNEHKERINTVYENCLPSHIQWGTDYSSWRFMLEVNNREVLLKAIFDAGLFAGTNFPSVAYLFRGEHPVVAEREQHRILNLFNDFRVDEKFASQICQIINANL